MSSSTTMPPISIPTSWSGSKNIGGLPSTASSTTPRKPKTLYLDQGPKQNYRRCPTRAPSVRFDPLELGMPVSRRCPARPSHAPRTRGGGTGLEVSLCGLCQDQFVQRQIRDRSMKTAVLSLQLLEPL